jgi:hypothetical protein
LLSFVVSVLAANVSGVSSSVDFVSFVAVGASLTSVTVT